MTKDEAIEILREALKTCETGVWVDRGDDEHLWDHNDHQRADEALEFLAKYEGQPATGE